MMLNRKNCSRASVWFLRIEGVVGGPEYYERQWLATIHQDQMLKNKNMLLEEKD
jgi:hypothetical protein